MDRRGLAGHLGCAVSVTERFNGPGISVPPWQAFRVPLTLGAWYSMVSMASEWRMINTVADFALPFWKRYCQGHSLQHSSACVTSHKFWPR